DLVHGRSDYQRLIWRACPAVVLGHASSQREDAERLLAGAGQRTKALGDLDDDAVLARHQRGQKLATALGDLIHYYAAIHHHRDAPWAPSLTGVVLRVQREREERHVDTRRLAHTGRQVEYTRPRLVGNNL